MIVGPDGKRIGNTLMETPKWMVREWAHVLSNACRSVEEARVLDLRRSVGVDTPRMGNTIDVRLPERYR